jgi:hypothetical protein
MKKILLPVMFFVCCNTVPAQLIITPGAELYMSGNAQLTLQNIDLVNNGTFTAGNGTVFFTGNASSAISGSQPIQFYGLEINKTAASILTLQRTINVTQQINFVNGFLNLNNFNTDLGTTGTLLNEQENSRITGATGGRVLFSTTLNAPAAVNPANLGAIFTSAQNLGTVTIERGHQSQVNSSGSGNSVLRYFDISPANNTALDATLRFQYFDGELNGLDENSLVFWKSLNTTNWTNEGFTSRNTTINYVEKTGIPSFSRWTLSSPGNALPVLFILFNVNCGGNNVLITWKTAQEQNISHFAIERSTDGITWTIIGNRPAAGNSSSEKSYSFTDNNASQQSFYRIAGHDINGRVQYTSVLKTFCDGNDFFKLWPNPFTETVFVNITTGNAAQVIIRVFDNKGALIKIQRTDLLPGSNQVNVEMKNLPAGMYQLVTEWNNGQMKKTTGVIKQ